MSHKISIRLEDGLYDDISKMSGTLSDNCRTALKRFCEDKPKLLVNNQYDFEFVEHMQQEIRDLWIVVHELMTQRALNPKTTKKIVVLSQGRENVALEPPGRVISKKTNYTMRKRPRPSTTAYNKTNKESLKKGKTKKKGFWRRLFS